MSVRSDTTRGIRLRLGTALLVTLGLFVQACGDDGTSTTDSGDPSSTSSVEVDDTATDESTDGSVAGAEPAGGQSLGPGTAPGVYVVDGETRNATMASCEADAATVVRLLEGPSADHDGQLEIEISAQETPDPTATDEPATYEMQVFDISVASFTSGVFELTATTDPDGDWYDGFFTSVTDDSARLAAPPFVLDGDHLTGEVTLDQSHPEGETGTIDVSFDLTVPAEPSELC